MFMAGMLDHLNEIDVIFPVPGQAEIVVHHSIMSEEIEGRRLFVICARKPITMYGLFRIKKYKVPQNDRNSGFEIQAAITVEKFSS